MSPSDKVWKTFEFLRVLGAAEKIKGAAEKNKKNLKLTALASQQSSLVLSRNVPFCQENKNSNVDNFFPELGKNPPMSS